MSSAERSKVVPNIAQPRRKLRCRQLVNTLRGELIGGLTPAAMVRALTVGALIGCMPLIWGTSLLCLFIAPLLRLNPLGVQVGNFAAWPLQIILAYPYLMLGSAWFGTVPASTGAGPTGLLATLAEANGVAIGAWALTAPLLLMGCHLASRFLVKTIGRPLP